MEAFGDNDTADLAERVALVRSVDEPMLFSRVFERHVESVHRYLARRAGRSK